MPGQMDIDVKVITGKLNRKFCYFINRIVENTSNGMNNRDHPHPPPPIHLYTSDITYSSVYDCRIRFLNLAENFHKLIMKMIKAIC